VSIAIARGEKGTSKPNDEASLTRFTSEDKRKGRANARARACAHAARTSGHTRYSQHIHAFDDGTSFASPGGMSIDRVRVSPLVRGSISSDGLVLLDVTGGCVLASNIVGARIWRLIEEQHSVGDIARRIAGEFDIALDRASADVDAFVAALCARGVVSPEEPC
jgi:hypothetical protein